MRVNEILSGPFVQYQVSIRAMYSLGFTPRLRNVVQGKRVTLSRIIYSRCLYEKIDDPCSRDKN